MNDDLTRTFDLTDPAVLKSACEEMASGMEHQAIASNNRNAFQGHPQPGFFFGKAAQVFKAAAAYISLSDEGKPAKNVDGTRGGSDPTVQMPPPNPPDGTNVGKKK